MFTIMSCVVTQPYAADSGGYDDLYGSPLPQRMSVKNKASNIADKGSGVQAGIHSSSVDDKVYGDYRDDRDYIDDADEQFIEGYWLNDFRGSEYDKEEAYRIIAMYPMGFAITSADDRTAMELSFDSDWNVFTDGRNYWWFPSNSNFELYHDFIFGNYRKSIDKYIYFRPAYTYSPSISLSFSTFIPE